MEYSTSSLARTLKIPRVRLQNWVNLGLVYPKVAPSGKGSQAVYTDWYRWGIKLFIELMKLGISSKDASKCFQKWVSPAYMEEHTVSIPPYIVVSFMHYNIKVEWSWSSIVAASVAAGKRSYLVAIVHLQGKERE